MVKLNPLSTCFIFSLLLPSFPTHDNNNLLFFHYPKIDFDYLNYKTSKCAITIPFSIYSHRSQIQFSGMQKFLWNRLATFENRLKSESDLWSLCNSRSLIFKAVAQLTQHANAMQLVLLAYFFCLVSSSNLLVSFALFISHFTFEEIYFLSSASLPNPLFTILR